MHTVKPMDERTIVRACAETGIVVSAEEHQVGGLGNRVAAVVAQAKETYGLPVIMGMIGVKDRFGESGAPWELIKEFEVSAEHIAQKAKELYDFARRKGIKRPKASRAVKVEIERGARAGAAEKPAGTKRNSRAARVPRPTRVRATSKKARKPSSPRRARVGISAAKRGKPARSGQSPQVRKRPARKQGRSRL
jgi:hypothetical protein